VPTSVVVATAVIRDGLLLAARRTRPPELAGRWELPGGRVEPGESEEAAVARECAEELGIRVRATGRIGADIAITAGILRVHRAVMQDDSPEPEAREHGAVRWIGPDGLDSLDWIDADRAMLPELRRLL
jgi:8-oxo-dGTP diphosphatase